ncbi:Resuscitation-promoting factor Rpf2 [Candidatus Thermoflexus japonica]|uniref:Resuscitation-promoting factor Rpf2 n=1 Tax=Candidatus Thermoflexus japonica TaxID=2035417 RepID=A0A2H5Y4H6_9CHLR|nr:Resuscitation-promoting factor Rpf2 [Candidatus Thermoflexus japonica]
MNRWTFLKWIAWLGLGAFCLWGYWRSQQTVTILLDDRPFSIRTHQRTVGDVLREAGLTLRPEDMVSPPLTHTIRPPATISIRRARPVQILIEGRGVEPSRQIQLYTLHSDPQTILSEAGIALGPGDVLWVDGRRREAGSPALDGGQPPREIRVVRSAPLVVRLENGMRRVIWSTAPTVGAALREAGMRLDPADRLVPGPETPLGGGMQVSLFRARPITVEADGRIQVISTTARTVRELLWELGISLHGQDRVIPEEGSRLQGGEIVRVIRVAEGFEIEETSIPFPTAWEPDPNLELDTWVQKSPGRNGVLQRRIRVRYENGQEVGREVVDETVIRPPEPRVWVYGTKIVVRTLETPDGPIEYWRRIRMLATSYSRSTAGVHPSASYFGRTRTGLPMQRGIVAVDPRVIRLGWKVYVPGYGVGLAADTGGGIIGRRIDLGYDDEDLVLWYRWVDVYLLTPVPPPESIPYILPDWPTPPSP